MCRLETSRRELTTKVTRGSNSAPSRVVNAVRFALLCRRCFRHATCTSADELETAILAHTAETNAGPKPFTWAETADDVLASVAPFCRRTSSLAH